MQLQLRIFPDYYKMQTGRARAGKNNFIHRFLPIFFRAASTTNSCQTNHLSLSLD